MLYDINLVVTHAYDQPAQAGRHALRLLPRDLPGAQRCITTLLDIAPRPDERGQRVDFFGNSVVDILLADAHEAIEMRLRARVERLERPMPADASPGPEKLAAEIAATLSLAPDSPHHFLGASSRIRPKPPFAAYAREQVSEGMTTLQAVEAIGRALHRDMRFDAGATTVDTPPEEAFAARHGVCQDFSHIMIACLRSIGAPAAYVSGCLRTLPPPGKKRLAGADAMHAWVRAWCGTAMGWVEFDPTNDMWVGADHIAVAIGRDYADTAPVRGVIRTAGSQSASHSVDVEPAAA